MHSHPALDHAIVHGDCHAGGVRIVRHQDVPQAVADLLLLFPHQSILQAALGCCHTCLYTADASPSFVADRIEEHARLFDHATGEPRRDPRTEASEGLGQGAAI